VKRWRRKRSDVKHVEEAGKKREKITMINVLALALLKAKQISH